MAFTILGGKLQAEDARLWLDFMAGPDSGLAGVLPSTEVRGVHKIPKPGSGVVAKPDMPG